MSDTIENALAHENWYATTQGSYALMREKHLLQRVLSPWPRRGHSLLEVECGTGLFLEFFWEGGFDVSGLDSQLPLVTMAQERLGGRADIHTCVPDYLPYDDNSFDYVALINVLEFTPQPKAVLAEALRVAAKGVVIAFINPWSASGLSQKLASLLPCRRSVPDHGSLRLNAWQYYRMIRSLKAESSISLRSSLLGPPCMWRPLFACMNALTIPLPLGAFCVLRIDHHPLHTGTPLPLTLKSVSLKNFTPVSIMEHSLAAQRTVGHCRKDKP